MAFGRNKNNPNYTMTEKNGNWYPVDIRNNKIVGPSTGFLSKETCQRWINSYGDK